MKATAILPVKRFSGAKQRLAGGIDDERRGALVAAMLEDTLEAIAAARSIERTIVVSGDPRAQEIVAASGAEVLPDPSDEGHVPAVLAGIARAEAGGAECVVLLPGDCPLLDHKELDSMLTGLPAHFVAVVPDRESPAPTPSPSPHPGRSVRPSARAAAPATSPPPARPAFPMPSRSLPRSASTSTRRGTWWR